MQLVCALALLNLLSWHGIVRDPRLLPERLGCRRIGVVTPDSA
jgi:hypothetical protein